jgi:hypothetical protein
MPLNVVYPVLVRVVVEAFIELPSINQVEHWVQECLGCDERSGGGHQVIGYSHGLEVLGGMWCLRVARFSLQHH